MKYPELEFMRCRRGITKKAIASALGISGRSLYNKMKGIVPFTWPEVCVIQDRFFPDIPIVQLFAEEHQPRAG